MLPDEATATLQSASTPSCSGVVRGAPVRDPKRELLLLPQTKIRPSAVRAAAPWDVTERETNATGLTTWRGTALDVGVVTPAPSCPPKFEPQHQALPSCASPHVMSS